MNPGDLLQKLAFFAAIGAAVVFAPGMRHGRRSRLGEALFSAHAFLLVAALALLGGYFVAHRFEFEYVTRYSSRDLSPALTLAALWAGQEGSILLWAALMAVVGVFVFLQPGRLSAAAMPVVAGAQAFMTALLLTRSPFVRTPVAPADGLGLNPLLEDPWMIAHPPVLFVGYAALLAPFALSVAAMVRRDYKEWNRQVWPWSLFAVVSLGAGIVLGGVWAYKVLGWGGYWGWDPVENASLVPWLLAVAMLHGLLIQRTLGAMARTNLLLAVLAWFTVLGGTYLTRSGVLADFSVHSFADTGLAPLLTGFMAASALAGGGLLAARWREIGAGDVEWVRVTRESALWLGLMTVLVLAVLVTAGTTMPLLTGLTGQPASVRPEFYHRVIAPLSLALLLLMALAPALRWIRQEGWGWLRSIVIPVAVAAAGAGWAVAAGLRAPLWITLLFLSGAALAINAWMAGRLFRRGWMFGAGYLGHVGVAVMAVGIAISSAFGRTEKLRLVENQPVESLGYRVTFTGERLEPRDARVLEVLVEKGTWRMDARPRIMPSPRGDGAMKTPALDLVRDLYVAPIELVRGSDPVGNEPVWLEKGREVTVAGIGYTFTGFRMEQAERFVAYADLRVRAGGRDLSAAPGLAAGPEGAVAVPADLPGVGRLTIGRMDADRGRVALNLPQVAAGGSIALVEFSTKPMVNLVWVGAVLALIGTALAGIRRAGEPGEARRPARGAAKAGHARPRPA